VLINAANVAVGARGGLVEQVEQELLQLVLLEEIGNDEARGTALAVGTEFIRLPQRALAPDQHDAAEDVLAMGGGHVQFACQPSFWPDTTIACNFNTVAQLRAVAALRVARAKACASFDSMMPFAHHRYAARRPSAKASGAHV
jgi:hypothetical protein